jgi:hypothetical protein
MFQSCVKLGTRTAPNNRSGWQAAKLRAIPNFIPVPFSVHTSGCTGQSFCSIIISNIRFFMQFSNSNMMILILYCVFDQSAWNKHIIEKTVCSPACFIFKIAYKGLRQWTRLWLPGQNITCWHCTVPSQYTVLFFTFLTIMLYVW